MKELKKAENESKKELEKLQKNRTKANKTKKEYWQNRVNEHFGLI